MSKIIPLSTQQNMCLSANTRVLVSGSGYVPASEVTLGSMLVKAYDSASTTRVIDVRHSLAANLIQINQKLAITAGHPMLTSHGLWVAADRLKIGDWLVGPQGPQRVESVKCLDGSAEVIDIVTPEPFLIEGLITMTKSMLHKFDMCFPISVTDMHPSMFSALTIDNHASL